MSTEELRAKLSTLKQFQVALSEFDATLRRLHEGQDHRDHLTSGDSNLVVKTPEPDPIDVLDQLREAIARDIEEMDRICDQYGIPYVWHIYPRVRGPIRTFNVFRAFINLALDKEERPPLVHLTDLIAQASWRCETEIVQATLPKKLGALRRFSQLASKIFR